MQALHQFTKTAGSLQYAFSPRDAYFRGSEVRAAENRLRLSAIQASLSLMPRSPREQNGQGRCYRHQLPIQQLQQMPHTAKHERRLKLNMKSLTRPLHFEPDGNTPKYLLGVQAILREKTTIEKTVPLTEANSLERARSPRQEIYVPQPAGDQRNHQTVKTSLSLSASREAAQTKQGFETPRKLSDVPPTKIPPLSDLKRTLDDLPSKLLNQSMPKPSDRQATLSEEYSPDSPDPGSKTFNSSLPKDLSGPHFRTITRKDAETSEPSLKEASQSPLHQSLVLPPETWKQQTNTVINIFDQAKKASNAGGVSTPRQLQVKPMTQAIKARNLILSNTTILKDDIITRQEIV